MGHGEDDEIIQMLTHDDCWQKKDEEAIGYKS